MMANFCAKNVLLVGAGQLGSRYLQGLVSFEDPLAITVVDQSECSLTLARERVAQAETARSHDVQYYTKLEAAPQKFDLALVVTPSNCRARVVEEISSRHEVKGWILEKVLAQSCEQLDQIKQALSSSNLVWVNIPRRLMSWHQAIRSQLLPDGSVPLQVRVVGGSWGLACNAIHFIDLVAWWTQAEVQSISADGLDGWVNSKRAGFKEVFGSLLVHYTDGSVLELSCLPDSQPAVITVEAPQGTWRVEEAVGVATGPAGLQLQGQLSFQSALTAPLVAQILQDGYCALPTLAESIAQHRPLLQALVVHWNRTQGRQDFSVPIT
jgi:predicted dehydrogenase